MNDLKAAFGHINAEQALKAHTVERLCAKPRRVFPAARLAAAVCALALAAGGFLYFTPAAFLGIDINPSLELGINAFGRVISAGAYNEDGQRVLETLPLKHKTMSAALLSLMERADSGGLLGEIVAVTLQSGSEKRADALALTVEQEIAGYIAGHHCQADAEVFTVSREIRDTARELGVSPARYLAILQLMDSDPDASIESCKGHSLGMLYELAENHGHHYGGEQSSPPQTTGGHHGKHH